MIIDYAQIEDDIKEKLDSLSEFDIVTVPDSEKDFQKPFTKTKVTIAYIGNKYQETEGLGNIVQRTEVLFTLHFQARKLRGDGGLYAALANVPELLLGFEPTFCGKMFLKEQTPIEKDGDLHSFHQIYGCYTVLTETLPDPNEVELNTISFQKS